MINRLRVVLPADSVLVAVFLIFLLAEGPFVFFEWQMQQPLDLPRVSQFVLRIVAFFYGLWRLASFHPALNPPYRVWLERTPWTRKNPLPGGPVALVWEDLLPLGALVIMAAFVGPLAAYVALNLFLIGYLMILVITTITTKTRWFGYLITFGIGLGIRFWPDPRVAFAALVVTYGFSQIALWVGLGRFPWKDPLEPDPNEFEGSTEELCGWPFDQLKPKIAKGWSGSRVDGLMFGLLVGWFLFAAESFLSTPGEQLVLVRAVFGGGILLLTLMRLMTYSMGYAPPINLLGRIRTFRWIIPGYDQIFVGPVCVLLVGVLALDRFRPPGLDDLIVLPIGLAAAITVAIDTGPSLRSWKLTGRHRLTSPKLNGDFVKVG